MKNYKQYKKNCLVFTRNYLGTLQLVPDNGARNLLRKNMFAKGKCTLHNNYSGPKSRYRTQKTSYVPKIIKFVINQTVLDFYQIESGLSSIIL